MKYTPDFNTKVCGIPCGVVVESYHKTEPTYSCMAETPEEYYGDLEIEYFLVDRKGYRANWLQNKMDQYDKEELEIQIVDHYETEEY